uniref:Sulfotransferase n=1 Tax=Electrophorus electricus TaxID=8005 RepID=A0A4W4DNQ7_ELEEL
MRSRTRIVVKPLSTDKNRSFTTLVNIYFVVGYSSIQHRAIQTICCTIYSLILSTTWVSYMLDLLYFSNTVPKRQTSLQIYMRVPFLELDFPDFPVIPSGLCPINCPPHLIKTHLPVQLVPKTFWEQNCRVLYVARNAKDNAVSYFHFEQMAIVQPEPGDWSTFLQNYMDGNKVFGPWYDHDIVEDTGHELERLCSFLCISASAEERERITKSTHFDAMKQNNVTNYSDVPIMDFKISMFMRKVGDWKNHFTVAQNEKFDEHYKQRMKNTMLQFRTEV